MSESNRSMRITMVRRQEAEIARQNSQAYKTAMAQKQEADRRSEVQKKYFEKQQLIAQLQQQRERAMSHMGEAHRQAEEAREAQLREEDQKRKRHETFKQNAWTRGQNALQKEIEEKENRIYTENKLNLARKNMLDEEIDQARQKAAEFRTLKDIKDRERAEEEAAAYVPPSGLVISGPIDYTRTHFHNPVIVKHGLEADISGLEKAQQAEQEAYERMTAKEADQDLCEERRKQRGDKAINIELLKEDYQSLETELKKLHYADGEYKKLLGVYDPVCYNRTLAKDEQDRKVKEAKMEQAYEDLFVEAPPEPIVQPVGKEKSANVHQIPTVPTIPSASPMNESSEMDSKFESRLDSSGPEKTRIVLQEHAYQPVFPIDENSRSEETSVELRSPERKFATKSVESSKMMPNYSTVESSQMTANYSPEKSEMSLGEPSLTSPVKSTIIEDENESSEESDSDLSDEDDVTDSILKQPGLSSFDPKNYAELETYEENKEPRRYDFYTRPDQPLAKSFEHVKTSSSEEESSDEEYELPKIESKTGPCQLTESELLESQPARPMAAYENIAQETPNFAQKIPKSLGDSSGPSKALADSAGPNLDDEFSLHNIVRQNVIPEVSGDLSSSDTSSDEDLDDMELGQSSVFDSDISSKLSSSNGSGRNIQVTQKQFSLDSELLKPSINEEYELSSSSEDDSDEYESPLKPVEISDDTPPDPITTSDLMDSAEQREPTLAEAFAAKRRNMTDNFRNREQEIKKPSETRDRTKSELLELRKQMMKPKTQPVPREETKEDVLMSRLIKGEKPNVDKKEMKQLTKKNYHQLPEVLKKREEDAKKEEQRLRREKVKEFERQRRNQRASSKH